MSNNFVYVADIHSKARPTHGAFISIREQVSIQSFGADAQRAAHMGATGNAKSIYPRLRTGCLPAI